MKRNLGLVLFWFSWLLWPLTFVVPFVLDAEVETVAVVTAAVLFTGEICFGLSLLLLGRPFYEQIKGRILSCWRRWRGEKKALK